MKNNNDTSSERSRDADTNADDDTVPQAVVGVLPMSAGFGSGMAGTTTAGNQGAYPGGAAILPIATAGVGGDAEDHQIAEELENALAEEPTLAPHATAALQFSVENGVVHLSGEVPTDHDHQIILTHARKITGVSEVRDSLQIA